MHHQHFQTIRRLLCLNVCGAFYGPNESFGLCITGTGKPFKTLVDDYLMNQEISKSIAIIPKPRACIQYMGRIVPNNMRKNWDGKDYKEEIIPLKESRAFYYDDLRAASIKNHA